MLGPLKFGLQPPAVKAAVPTVKAAVAPGRFELTLELSLNQGREFEFSAVTLRGPPGATASLNYTSSAGTPNQTSFTIPPSGIIGRENFTAFSSNATFTGSNLITEMYIRANDSCNITGITGTYPTALKLLQLGFNYVNPTFTPPNVEALLFAGKNGPSSLTTGSNLTRLDFPPNLTRLNLSASTKLTTLPTLPVGLEYLTTPSGLIGLTGLPAGLTSLDAYYSTKLTSLPTLPVGLTTLTTPSGLIGLTGLPTSLTRLDTSGSTKLTSLPDLSGITGLIDLYISPGVKNLPALPSNIGVLGIRYASGLTVLPDLSGFTKLRFLETPSGLRTLPALPSGLTQLYTEASTNLTSLPNLPVGLINLSTPPGITGLSTVPSNIESLVLRGSTKLTTVSIQGKPKLTQLILPSTCKSLDISGCTGLKNLSPSTTLTSLDISNCTGLTGIPVLPALTTLRIDGSGLTSLDLTKTNVTTLNIPPSMNSQLRTLKVAGSKLKLAGLLDYSIPQGVNWTLY